MKKLLVALLAVCLVFSSLSFTALAEADADTTTQDTVTTGTTEETKTVESLVGAFYLQGESGAGLMGNGEAITSDYDYQIADKMATALTGTNKIPFYAYDKEGSVFFDSFAEDYLISEANAAKAAGIDFFAYKYYSGYDNATENPIRNMNSQLIRHTSIFSNAEFTSKLKFAIVIDGDFDASKTKERGIIIDRFLIMKGYLTATDGRPVVFIEWNDDIDDQITKLNKDLKKAVANGLKKNGVKTQLNDDVEAMYVVALNAPSYDEAIAKGADAVSWTEGTGKDGEAYTNMTATVEANWANGEKVIPNVVTGFDKTLLAKNPIEIIAKKNNASKTEADVRYSRSGSADQYVAAATAEELVNHVKNAVATTNKPAEFSAVMMYAWDDFMGGAYLCPTKTDAEYQYNTDYIKALREYFYGKTEGMAKLSVLDNKSNIVETDEAGVVTTYAKDGTIIAKVDKDGKNLLEVAGGNEGGDPSQPGDNGNATALDPMIFVYAGIGVVVLVAVIVIIVVASKKKKTKTEE